jgi:putative inorganic carbon (HCO3(-)) transporter
MLTYHRCYLGYLLSVNVLSLAVIGAFARGGIQGSMYALGMSKNFTGPVLGCGIGVAVVYLVTEGIRGRRGIWLLGTLGLASGALILTLSRGAWIATAVGTLIAVCTTRNFRLVIIGGIVGLIGCAATWKLLPDTATEYASNVSSKASSINLRLQYIDYVMARFRSNPVFGVGVGLRKVMEPHNVIVLTAGESGVVGVAAFVGMFVAGLWTTISAWRRAKHLIAARQLAAMATVVFSIALIDGMMDVYWRRGIGFMGWAGVGIAVLVGRSIPRAAAPVRRPLIGRDVPVAV